MTRIVPAQQLPNGDTQFKKAEDMFRHLNSFQRSLVRKEVDKISDAQLETEITILVSNLHAYLKPHRNFQALLPMPVTLPVWLMNPNLLPIFNVITVSMTLILAVGLPCVNELLLIVSIIFQIIFLILLSAWCDSYMLLKTLQTFEFIYMFGQMVATRVLFRLYYTDYNGNSLETIYGLQIISDVLDILVGSAALLSPDVLAHALMQNHRISVIYAIYGTIMASWIIQRVMYQMNSDKYSQDEICVVYYACMTPLSVLKNCANTFLLYHVKHFLNFIRHPTSLVMIKIPIDLYVVQYKHLIGLTSENKPSNLHENLVSTSKLYLTVQDECIAFKFRPIIFPVYRYVQSHLRPLSYSFLLVAVVGLASTVVSLGPNRSFSYILGNVCNMFLVTYMLTFLDKDIIMLAFSSFDYWFIVLTVAAHWILVAMFGMAVIGRPSLYTIIFMLFILNCVTVVLLLISGISASNTMHNVPIYIKIFVWSSMLGVYTMWRIQDQVVSYQYPDVSICSVYYDCGRPLSLIKNIEGSLIMFMSKHVFTLIRHPRSIVFARKRVFTM